MHNHRTFGYSSEKNVQILISLLKAHKVRLVIASPGTSNASFVVSIQNDPYFTIYSCVDERSAAYMACGMAAESGEPVVISCTGATAARNYLSGLTEAYYRKLPIIAINSTRPVSKVGHLVPQVNDQSELPKDIANITVTLPIIKDEDDVFDCEIKVNQALLEVKHRNGGPVHIVLPTTYSKAFVPHLPEYRAIYRVCKQDKHPSLEGNVAVLIGSHRQWTETETAALERFAIANHAPIFCEHISNYFGKNRLHFSLASSQEQFNINIWQPDILIQIGEISGDYSSLELVGKQVWRVNEDGKIRDTFHKLKYVFEMSEVDFFEYYAVHNTPNPEDYFSHFNKLLNSVRSQIPEVPFSNIWIASKMAAQIPQNASIHFGILNTLRAWNFFDIHDSIRAFSNVGGFGIDGCLSSLIGASLIKKQQLFYGFLGDLSFFYDMSSLGNRHLSNNLRILLINNGEGVEFKNYNHHAIIFGDEADPFIAAKGHFGNLSPNLVKHYAEDLGFIYLSASNKDECKTCFEQFLNPEITDKPILFEAFTKSENESMALKMIQQILKPEQGKIVNPLEKSKIRFS